jgi:1-acyl-sn-glycerol-3-phosphate acyltransferase
MIALIYYRVMRTYVQLTLSFFFRKWQVAGKDRIPKNAPIIFVVNHQNAFLDAILVETSSRTETWFLTRAGVFGNKIVAWLLSLFHMIPVYRFRDGVKGLRNNDIVFQTCVRLLSERQTILIFGEGDQNMHYHLRVMQKGFARIAWALQQQHNWQLPLYIVPVGVQYDHYFNFRSRVLVNYGMPIPINAAYQTLPEREFLDTVVDIVKTNLKSLMLHIDHEQYDDIERAIKSDRSKKDLVEQLTHDQKIVAGWPDSYRKPVPVSRNYALLALTLPLHVYAWINNFIPYLIIHALLDKFVTRGFRGSLKVGFGMVIVPIFYLAQTSVLQVVLHDWRISLAYLITLPFLSVWSVDIWNKGMERA